MRFRDIAQIWELGTQLLIFASPVMYPMTILPVWVQKIAALNPLVQVMQDLRHIVIGLPAEQTTAGIYGTGAIRIVPIAITLGLLALGLVLFRRESPRFAERV